MGARTPIRLHTIALPRIDPPRPPEKTDVSAASATVQASLKIGFRGLTGVDGLSEHGLQRAIGSDRSTANGSSTVPRIRARLAIVLSAVAAAAVLTPFAMAQAQENGTPGGSLKPDRIDLTGGAPAGAAAGTADAPALAPTGVPGLAYCRRYYIWNVRASRYVAEEQGYSGSLHNVLRARTSAGSVGSWEQFSICSSDGGHTVYLTAPSGYLVTAEYNYSGTSYGVLRGRGQWVDVWETFDVWSENGKYFLRNVSRGTFVTCRVDYTGSSYNMVKGSGASAGRWEQLRFDPVPV